MSGLAKYLAEIKLNHEAFTAYLIINQLGFLDIEIVNSKGITVAQLGLKSPNLRTNQLAIYSQSIWTQPLLNSGLIKAVQTIHPILICQTNED